MGNTANKALEAHTRAKSKPKNNHNVQQQKIKTARTTNVLALSNSKLKTLPQELLELSSLRTLDLTCNKLSKLPTHLNNLLALKTLKVSSNVLIELPDMSKLEALTTLVLDNNLLEDIPNALPPNLIKLSLKGNKLRVIPRSVLDLAHLQELDVSDNAITTLPLDLDTLKELQELNIDGNKLVELPATLGRCSKLKVLSARRNSLVGVSKNALGQSIAAEVLGEGSTVQVLNLEGNPMTKEDLQGMDGFQAFLKRRTQLKNKEIHGGLNSDLSICGLE
ncbi:FOG: Leucine rich repeat [Plasmopara halstedii]|uniref:FOG: Leucine rich repeat n=1 Tax=Plasmopara halstedii TaxID=4781 RepID=A0A0P1AUL3_PLAHL|nr:FOG: Leucine rich repeat [Plasmopara halstedii]CEG45317.1 FOG: Leucine rich repeat [Plasmopara halstedii]|eukprot:XP_024581686.1 FOG: Leucine rich repeat [Plasmopara halstedii]